MKRWYVVYCKPQQDARAEEHLRNQAYEVFRPQVRVRRRHGTRFQLIVESMFPRYLFIRLDDSNQNWAPIRSTRGVSNLVCWGSQIPHVPDFIVDKIRSRLDKNNCVVLMTGDYRPNERLRIVEGPFTGNECLFSSRSGQERIIVLLEIMQQTQRLELSELAVECV